MCLFRILSWVGVVDVTVENVFMGGYTFLEYIYGWVWMFVTVRGTFMGGYTFFEFIYGWV